MWNITDDEKAAKILLGSFGLKMCEPDLSLLQGILSRFSRLPYENLTKIVKRDHSPRGFSSFRLPLEIVSDHLTHGSGGTCFSLVYLLKRIFDVCGFDSRLILADRRYGENTHCAIVVNLKDGSFLADPGFLVFTPLLLPEVESIEYETRIQPLLIKPSSSQNLYDVYSIHPGGYRKFRYCLKNEKIDRDTFFDVWKKSFDLEMMNYPVITKIVGGEHIYIREEFFHRNSRSGQKQRRISSAQLIDICKSLGISPQITRKALSVLGRI